MRVQGSGFRVQEEDGWPGGMPIRRYSGGWEWRRLHSGSPPPAGPSRRANDERNSLNSCHERPRQRQPGDLGALKIMD